MEHPACHCGLWKVHPQDGAQDPSLCVCEGVSYWPCKTQDWVVKTQLLGTLSGTLSLENKAGGIVLILPCAAGRVFSAG